MQATVTATATATWQRRWRAGVHKMLLRSLSLVTSGRVSRALGNANANDNTKVESTAAATTTASSATAAAATAAAAQLPSMRPQILTPNSSPGGDLQLHANVNGDVDVCASSVYYFCFH